MGHMHLYAVAFGAALFSGTGRISGHCGQRTVADTQKIDTVLAKRACVTQNTDYIIMLLMSVCQYDLESQRLLSG